jgi:catalase
MLPVNSPKAALAANYQRDGAMNFGGADGAPNYYPNSFNGPTPYPASADPAVNVTGKAQRQPYIHPNNDFVQAGDLYRKAMTDTDRANLVGNIVSHLHNAQKRLQLRQTSLFYKADPQYGSRVAEGLGLNVAEVKALSQMSQEERVKATA